MTRMTVVVGKGGYSAKRRTRCICMPSMEVAQLEGTGPREGSWSWSQRRSPLTLTPPSPPSQTHTHRGTTRGMTLHTRCHTSVKTQPCICRRWLQRSTSILMMSCATEVALTNMRPGGSAADEGRGGGSAGGMHEDEHLHFAPASPHSHGVNVVASVESPFQRECV